MDFVELTPGLVLEPGPFGIPTPPAHATATPLDDAELVLVPGLAFDRRGGRLGQGGGYYDCALGRAPGPLRVGLCYDFQLVHHVPMEAGDEPVDIVVTPSGTFETFARARTLRGELP
jgi:5-formyltetrahydrofolate cyclo-ligase